MFKDQPVVRIENSKITEIIDTNHNLLPLYFRNSSDLESWLASRAIDRRRTNSRLLKKALRIKRSESDAQVSMHVNGAAIIDFYWVKPEGSSLTWKDIQFTNDKFALLALRGDPDSFSQEPSRTPELTNTGSFEKSWKLADSTWYLVKSGNYLEYFSELFISLLGKSLGFDMAEYRVIDGYIQTPNFTSDNLFFEPMSSLTDNDDYQVCYSIIQKLKPGLEEDYLKIVWLDTICSNLDRHTGNFGFLRSGQDGGIVKMAPNFDNNIALIARGIRLPVPEKRID